MWIKSSPILALGCLVVVVFFPNLPSHAQSGNQEEDNWACCLAYLRGGTIEGTAQVSCRRDIPASPLQYCSWLKQYYPGRKITRSERSYAHAVVRHAAERHSSLKRVVSELEHNEYSAAVHDASSFPDTPIDKLIRTLLSAWATFGAGDASRAVGILDRMTGEKWYSVFKHLNAGLILDLAGHHEDAGKRFARAYEEDPSALRVVEAYASWLSRNVARDKAVEILMLFDHVLPNHPLILSDIRKLKNSELLPPLVGSPQEGAAEALYTLGASIGMKDVDRAIDFLQSSTDLWPQNSLALLSLADIYEKQKKYAPAIEVYERVPKTSLLYRNAEIQVAADLDSLGLHDQAESRLAALITEDPKDTEAIVALGNVQREQKKFAECATTYGKAIDTLAHPQKSNWPIYYFRGICYERSNEWPKAEPDFQQALKLFPEQPHVLNYLGYSLISRGLRVDEAMDMIKRAVAQRPDDGYIVDSLGWAYYKRGDYSAAVEQLKRASGLKEDPTIFDHYGDALWRSGNSEQARMYWTRALELHPDPSDAEKIKLKIRDGLK